MKLSICICVCVMLVSLVAGSPVVTRSNYRGKRGNNQPFTSPPCNSETTLICRHLPHGDYDACMNPRAAQEQIRLGHATLGECPDPCADCNQTTTGLSIGDLVDVDLTEAGNRKRAAVIKPGDDLVSDGNGMFVLESHKITICHNPEGPSPQTIVISAQALQSHLAHGDLEGVCPDCFCSLDELEDVSIVNATDCHVVHFTEEGGWENKNIREIVNNTLVDLDDTTIVNPEDCNVIHYQDGTWENKDIREIVNNTVVDLDDTCAENPQAGDHLVYNGTCYKNTKECPSGCDLDACPSGCDLDACPSGCDAVCSPACDDVCPSACGTGGPGGPGLREQRFLSAANIQVAGNGVLYQLNDNCPAGYRIVTGGCKISQNTPSGALLITLSQFGPTVSGNGLVSGWQCGVRTTTATGVNINVRTEIYCEAGPTP